MIDLKQSTIPQPDFSDKQLLIDGDSIAFIIGWNNKDVLHEEYIKLSVDSFMRDFFTLMKTSSHKGVISSETDKANFRYSIYRYAPYKGNRPEIHESIARWKPVINTHLLNHYNFRRAPAILETDDIIAALQYQDPTAVVCSPDKDMKQLPGVHVCYKTGKIEEVSEQKAHYNWCMQMLCGDTADNVKGIPGIGEETAKKMLLTEDPILWKNKVKLAYQKYFGSYYGPIIYEETEYAITLMTPKHPLWEIYSTDVEKYLDRVVTSG